MNNNTSQPNRNPDGPGMREIEAAEHFETLFEIASRGGVEYESLDRFSAPDRELIIDIQEVLGAIRSELPVTAADLDEAEGQFLRLLAEEEPGHPWINRNTSDNENEIEVKTLGDVARLSAYASTSEPPHPDLSQLSQSVWETLARNTTPISDIADPARRTAILGAVFKEAGVAKVDVPKMFQWASKSIGSLTPGQNGVFIARRQKKKSEKQR